MYKHYVKIDNDNRVIDSFSSWQVEKFDGSEIEVNESVERHFNLVLILDRVYILKWQGNKIKDRTKKEKDDDRAFLPVIKTELQNLIDVLVDKNLISYDDLGLTKKKKKS